MKLLVVQVVKDLLEDSIDVSDIDIIYCIQMIYYVSAFWLNLSFHQNALKLDFYHLKLGDKFPTIKQTRTT